MIYAAIFLLFLSLIMYIQSGRRRKAAGLPGGRVIYTDTKEWGEVEVPLYDPVAKLTGRPDYLVKTGKDVIPVEVKSGRTPNSPYDSHIFQVAAYCMLVEREYKKRPPYGIIKYTKRSFAIDYTRELEDALLDLLTEMRKVERRDNVVRSHEQVARCRGCGYAKTCDEKL